jgi:chromosome segregation ATPase
LEKEDMQRQINSLQTQIDRINTDRDSWRDQAAQVPALQSEILNYRTLLAEKDAQVNEIIGEKSRLIGLLEQRGMEPSPAKQ